MNETAGKSLALAVVATTAAALYFYRLHQQSKGDGDEDGTSTPTVDLQQIAESFTPLRQQRYTKQIKKVRTVFGGFDAGPLRGGDWVFDKKGDGCTLAFCFQYNSQWYGLTTGHLFEKEEDVFVAHHILANGMAELDKIGKCVSQSSQTDSMVFIIDAEWVQDFVTDRLLDQKAGLLLELRLPKEYIIPTEGSYLLGFGAQRRGALGRVTTPLLPRVVASDPASEALSGDIGISGDQKEQLSDDGDCGCIHFDSHGVGVSMHHVCREYGNVDPGTGEFVGSGEYESFGAPLFHVMSCHKELGGGVITSIRRFLDTRQAGSRPERTSKFIDSQGKARLPDFNIGTLHKIGTCPKTGRKFIDHLQGTARLSDFKIGTLK